MPDGFYDDDKATLGDRIVAARESAGLSSEEFARKLGVRHRTVEAWEADRIEPRANRLQMLAGMLGVSLVWLLTGYGTGPDGEPDSTKMAGSQAAAELHEVRMLLSFAVERLSRLEAGMV